MYRSSNYLLLFLFLTTLGCRKPYDPPVVANPPSYLVVEGTIVSGPDSTIIKLTHTVSLSNGHAPTPVANAAVTVESDANVVYPLTEIRTGYYIAPGLNLDNTAKYRLRIKTPDNQQYLSDFVPVNITPPIDSIGFTTSNAGLNIYANTHDPQNNTHYYRWEYTETWQFHAMYSADLITDGTKLINRTPSQQIYYCFANDVSSTILLWSSAKLAQDVIYQSPIAFVPSTSEKVELKYSILVRQYGLTSDAFKFWTNLKKNTEQLGSIFDAEPSQINGNIHNIANQGVPAIGYISACAVQTKRIFISNTQLPAAWRTTYPFECPVDSLLYSDPITKTNQVQEFLIPLGTSELSFGPIYKQNVIIGYLGTDLECADCTIRGVTQAPGFWR